MAQLTGAACVRHVVRADSFMIELTISTMRLRVAAQVEVTHLGKKKRKYRVKGLEQAANRLMFRNEQENRDMSVAEYFEATYHIKCGLHFHSLCLSFSNNGSGVKSAVAA